MAALGVDESAVATGDRRRPGDGAGGSRREARYAVLGAARRALRRATWCCWATPSTTRPRRCCSGWRGVRVRGRWPGCGGASTGLPAPAARRAPATTPRRPARPRASSGGATRTTATPGSPASRVRRRCCRLLEDELGPGVAAALARTADLLRERHGALDDGPQPAFASRRADDGLAVDAAARRRCPPRSATGCCALAAIRAGAIASELTRDHVLAVDALRHRLGTDRIQLPGHLTAYAGGPAVPRTAHPRHAVSTSLESTPRSRRLRAPVSASGPNSSRAAESALARG